MSSIDYFQLLKLSGPEAVLAMAALAVLAVDLIWMRESPIRQRQGAGAFVSILGCLGAGVCALQMPGFGSFANGMLVIDPLTLLLKGALLVLTVFTVLL